MMFGSYYTFCREFDTLSIPPLIPYTFRESDTHLIPSPYKAKSDTQLIPHTFAEYDTYPFDPPLQKMIPF